MKKKTRLVSMLLIALFTASFLTGCGTKKITNEESAKMFFNVAAHQDISELNNLLGKDSSNFDSLVADQIDDAKETVNKMLSSSGMNLTDEEINNFVDSILNAMKQQECKNVTVRSDNGDTVDLTFEITYVDVMSLCTTVSKDLQEQFKQKLADRRSTNTSYKELKAQFVKDYFATITDKLNNYGVGTETKTFNYTFEKSEYKTGFMSKVELWAPKDSEKFGKKVGSTCVGF